MRLRTSSQQQQKSTANSSSIELEKQKDVEMVIKTEQMDTDEVVAELIEPKQEKNYACAYCGELRKLGGLEVCCSTCKQWFHQACFKNLENFGGLPFMVSYVFCCQNCSLDKREKWSLRNTSIPAMAVMTLANMTLNYRLNQPNISSLTDNNVADQNPYFNITNEIIPYMDKNWQYLSTTPRRQKKNWPQTITKILQREAELFEQSPADGSAFALKERDLFRIGPINQNILQLFKRNRDAVEREASALHMRGDKQQPQQLGTTTATTNEGGPKTRGASKRKAATSTATTTNVGGNGNGAAAAEALFGGQTKQLSINSAGGGAGGGGSGVQQQKKIKMTAEFATVQIDGQFIDFPFNREGYRYYLVEKDPNIPNREKFDTEEVNNTRAVQIPSHIYRIVIPSTVFLSPNDKANQLYLELDNLTITGHEGYAMARATHSVSYGTWYYEMEFLSQPSDSQFHVRVGWAQSYCVLQACVGYSKFSYGWRSKKGTVFHDGYGKHYHSKGFGQGDVIGCLIHLPTFEKGGNNAMNVPISEILPASRKDCDLIKFKQTCFFEEKEETQLALQRLKPLKNSKIEFYLNGQCCGVAFDGIYSGHYFPAVSMFQSAKVRLNFGPYFRHPPQCVREGEAKAMSDRPEEMYLEQAIADMAYMVANESELEQRNAGYFEAILTKEN